MVDEINKVDEFEIYVSGSGDWRDMYHMETNMSGWVITISLKKKIPILYPFAALCIRLGYNSCNSFIFLYLFIHFVSFR